MLKALQEVSAVIPQLHLQQSLQTTIHHIHQDSSLQCINLWCSLLSSSNELQALNNN